MATRIATLSARTKHARASQHASSSSRLSRHQRKCTICHHPERDTIEEMFVHWHSPSRIYSRFMLPERSDEAPISSNGIVAAIKAYASLTTSGEWVEPARRVIYTSVSSPAPQRESANHSPRPLANKNAAYVYPQSQSRPSDYPSNYDPSDGWWAYSDAQARNAAALASSSSPSDGKSANHQPQSQNINPTSPANTSAPAAARAPQTTTHNSPAPTHSTTTTTPGAPQQTKTTPQPANSNRYSAGLKIPPTHTKQTSAPHSNRYK